MRANETRTRHALGLLLWIAGLSAAFGLDDPRLRFPAFVVAFGVAQIGALLAGWAAGAAEGADAQTQRRRRALDIAAVGLGLAARIWALGLAPAFSDDVFRYVFEGRVVWATDLGFPFRVAPADAPAAGVPPELLDAAWLRINHPEIPTIYPPLAQLLFVASGGLSLALGLSALGVLKASLVAIEAATVGALARRAERRRGLLYAWWLSPLAIWATAREGHVDGLSACMLGLAVAAFSRGHVGAGHAGFAAAALAKLNGIVGLIVSIRRAPRGLGWAGLAMLAFAVPVVYAGLASSEGLVAYATRWRSGDGAFSIASWVAQGVLGGDWARVGGFTLTRDQLARAMVGGALLLLLAARLRRPAPPAKIPADAAFAILTLLLLAPTLHPWYGVWLIPFLALPGGTDRPWALTTLVVLVPLLHHASWLELADGRWRDLPSVRAVVHGGTWFALAAETFARSRSTDR